MITKILSTVILSILFIGNNNVNAAITTTKSNETGVGVTSDPTVPNEEAIKVISEFYTYQLANKIYSDVDINRIYDKFLSPRCLEQVKAMGDTEGQHLFDANIFTRSQDTGNAANTLNVKHLEDNWYMVSYIQDKDGKYEEKKEIPLLVTSKYGGCKIDYVTPEWDGLKYGNAYMTDEKIYGIDIQPENKPEYKDGENAMHNFLTNELKGNVFNLSGELVMVFDINKNGDISNLEIELTPEQKHQIWKVWQSMNSQWKPGTDKGNKVKTKVRIPISF